MVKRMAIISTLPMVIRFHQTIEMKRNKEFLIYLEYTENTLSTARRAMCISVRTHDEVEKFVTFHRLLKIVNYVHKGKAQGNVQQAKFQCSLDCQHGIKISRKELAEIIKKECENMGEQARDKIELLINEMV